MSLGSKIKIILGRFSGATILFFLDKALEMRGVYSDNPNLSNILVALSFGWLVFALLTWPQKRLAIGADFQDHSPRGFHNHSPTPGIVFLFF